MTGDETHGQLAWAEVREPRGSGSPVHTHHRKNEAWYFVDGELMFRLGKESRSTTTGDFVFGPGGVRHRFRVDSEVARFLIIVIPAGSEKFAPVVGRPKAVGTFPPSPRNEEERVAAARRHGIDIASP